MQSRETVEDAIKMLVGDNTSKDNLLSYYNGRLHSISSSLSQKQQNLTKLGQEGATVDANLRNIRTQLDVKQAELSGVYFRHLHNAYYIRVSIFIYYLLQLISLNLKMREVRVLPNLRTIFCDLLKKSKNWTTSVD